MSASRRALASAAFTAYLLLVLAVTLVPRGGEGAAWRACVACGERGLADALLNVLLFVPIGLGAYAGTGSRRRALLVAVLLSAGIEAIQGFVPGRFGNVGDILSNGTGAALGIALPAIRRRWRSATRPLGSGGALLAGGAAAALLLATGWLARPAVPEGRYFVFWTPDLGHLAPTDARVLRASLDGVSRPHGWVPDPERARRDLAAGRPIGLLFEPGTPPEGLAGLFAVYDDRQREDLLVGRERNDLVLRWRRRAARLRLGHPDLLVAGFFDGLGARDTVALSLRSVPARPGRCLRWGSGEEAVFGRTPEPSPGHAGTRCGLGLTVGRGWAFLLPFRAGPEARRLLDGGWIFLVGLGVGLAWLPRLVAWAGALLVAAALILVPAWTVLLPTPLSLYGSGAGGFVVGALLRRRRLVPDGDAQEPGPAIASATEAQHASIRS